MLFLVNSETVVILLTFIVLLGQNCSSYINSELVVLLPELVVL
jgi:hypothetical protein